MRLPIFQIKSVDDKLMIKIVAASGFVDRFASPVHENLKQELAIASFGLASALASARTLKIQFIYRF